MTEQFKLYQKSLDLSEKIEDNYKRHIVKLELKLIFAKKQHLTKNRIKTLVLQTLFSADISREDLMSL